MSYVAANGAEMKSECEWTTERVICGKKFDGRCADVAGTWQIAAIYGHGQEHNWPGRAPRPAVWHAERRKLTV